MHRSDFPMLNHIKIRAVARRDLRGIATMINEARMQGRFLRHSTRCSPPSLAAYMKKMRVCFPYFMLVLEVDGKVQGYLDFCELDGGVGHLIGMFISRSLRRKRLGLKLVNEALKMLAKRGCHKVRTEVYSANRPGTLFCKRMGFRREGILRDDEGHRNTAIWAKTIGRTRAHDKSIFARKVPKSR